MHSDPNFEQTDPRPILGSQDKERLASDEQTVREELARLQERQSSITHDVAAAALDPQITAFRPAVNNIDVRGGFNRSSVRGLIGILLVACIVGGAIIWQSSYGHAARLIIAQWTPQLISTASQPSEKAEAPSQPGAPPAVQMAAADAAAPQQPTAPTQTAPQDAAPAAALPSEQTQALQTMARDLADAQQKIAELKTAQEQLVRDNATTAEQLKAAQQQIARLTATAKVSEQNLVRPKPVAPPPPRRPIAAMTAPIRQPVSALPPPPAQAIAPPPVATQPQAAAYPPPAPAYPPQASAYPQAIPQPQGEQVQMSSTPRPPMPVPQ
jgi:hypothetical protein